MEVFADETAREDALAPAHAAGENWPGEDSPGKDWLDEEPAAPECWTLLDFADLMPDAQD